ncbi:hypothetical protein M3Y99_00138700 [Aphelenchoides fujianensis]|nr:hypothetical protein M3Y99_00138700 [Aphelenchoides fujianensis]
MPPLAANEPAGDQLVTTPSFAEANRKPLADPTGAHSQTPPSSSQSNGTPPSSQQPRNKSSVLPGLKVLHEEEASPRRIPRQQRTPIRCDSVDVDSPPEFAEESSKFSKPTAPLSPAESRAAVTPAAPHVRPPPPVDTHDPARPSPPPRRPPTATSSNEPPHHNDDDERRWGSRADRKRPPPELPAAPSRRRPARRPRAQNGPQLRKISPAIRLPAIGGDAPMGADGELVAKPDDEEDEQLGTVQRTFVSFLS